MWFFCYISILLLWLILFQGGINILNGFKYEINSIPHRNSIRVLGSVSKSNILDVICSEQWIRTDAPQSHDRHTSGSDYKDGRLTWYTSAPTSRGCRATHNDFAAIVELDTHGSIAPWPTNVCWDGQSQHHHRLQLWLANWLGWFWRQRISIHLA